MKKVGVIIKLIVLLGVISSFMLILGTNSFAKTNGVDEITSGISSNYESESTDVKNIGQATAETSIMLIVLFIIGVVIYFIPTFVAVSKKHPYKTPIRLIDIFLGWTLLGWVGALVWSCIIPQGAQQK